MSKPKYIHTEIDAYEWRLYVHKEGRVTTSGYQLIAEIRCDDVTIEKITDALNAPDAPQDARSPSTPSEDL